MFVVNDDIISDPYDRDIFTSNLSPSLASHAPNVSIIILIEGSISEAEYIRIGTNRTVLSIIPSRHSSLIKKWDRCIRRAKIIE